MGDTESFATWDETFRWLKGRGLNGVMFVVSDDHGGLTEAAARHFQGASWQRCQVHLMRNILGQCASRHRADVAAAAKLVLQAPDMNEAKRRLAEFVERFAKNCAEIGRMSRIRVRGCDGGDESAGEIPQTVAHHKHAGTAE